MGEVFLRLLRFSFVSIIQSVVHIHISFIYHSRYNLSNWRSFKKIALVAAEENLISSERKLYSQNLRPKQTPVSHMNMLKLENELQFLRKSKDGFLRNADTHFLYEMSVLEDRTLLGMATSDLTCCLSWGGPCLWITKHFISGRFLWWMLW
jgi:hypothetical protein